MNLTDGIYGNSNSWIGASNTEGPFYAGIDLGGMVTIASIAWGRDNGNGAFDRSDPGTDACGGQCDDRWQGLYVIEVTTDATPSGDSNWVTVGQVELTANEDTVPGGGLTGYLRHEYTLPGGPVEATGVRILVPASGLGGGTAIDEIEVYGPGGGSEIAPTISLTDGGVTVGWLGDVGARYFVEFSETMEVDQWQILPGADAVDPGPDGVASVMDTITDQKRFYRVGTR